MTDADKRSVRNLVHASGSVKEANDEIAHWFTEEELMNYKLVGERILYDVNLDGMLE
jgi:nucleoside-diphosphate kinase